MAGKASVLKKLWGAAKSAYGVGMARDKTVLRGLVSDRGRAGVELAKARGVLAEAEAAPSRVIEEATAKSNDLIEAYNKGQSRLNREVSLSFQHDPELAGEEAVRLMTERNATEGAKVLAEVESLSKAGRERAVELAKAIPGAKNAMKEAEAKFLAAVARANERAALERAPFGIQWNNQSHFWGAGEKVVPLVQDIGKDPIEGAQWLRRMGRQITGKGSVPQLVSRVVRGTGREVFPVTMEGKMGRVLDVVTSPGAVGVAATGAAGTFGGKWIAKKTGLYTDPAEDLIARQEELKEAEKTRDPERIEAARTAVIEAKKRAGGGKSSKIPVSSVDQSNTQWTFDQIATDYQRTGDTTARDRALAAMGDEKVKARLADIRKRVFTIHNPGMSIEQLGSTDAGQKFIRDFDENTFSLRTPQEWLTTDLDEYQRGAEVINYGEGN